MKQMKKTKLAAAILSLALLSGCGSGSSLVTLEYEGGLFQNKKQDLSYLPADIGYEPTSVGEAYAYYKKGDLTLYAIGGQDPTLWLTESYAGGATTVFYSDSIQLPTLATLGAEKIIVCQSENITIGVMEITDAATVAETVSRFTEGEKAEWPLVGSTLNYEMKFYSSDWPQIYINLIYGEFAEGCFLYDRASGRAVEVGDLFASYFHPDVVAESGETDA